jgi:nucleotide-binding universal stress UspA family protein
VAAADQNSPVLIGYDGSDFAKAAVKRAGEELASGRRALIVTVFEPLDRIPFFAVAGMSVESDTVSQLYENAKTAAGKIAEEGAALAREVGFEVETEVVEGNPVWDRIVELGEERDADLIVIGSRGLSGVKHALLGSVAAAVSQHSKRSVLIVHRP